MEDELEDASDDDEYEYVDFDEEEVEEAVAEDDEADAEAAEQDEYEGEEYEQEDFDDEEFQKAVASQTGIDANEYEDVEDFSGEVEEAKQVTSIKSKANKRRHDPKQSEAERLSPHKLRKSKRNPRSSGNSSDTRATTSP